MNAITISDEFLSLSDFAAKLPDTFDYQGQILHNGRNIIKRIPTSQGILVVKNFKGMYFFNRLAYSWFRKSKAARSYLYSIKLNKKGIHTPPPVAWIDSYSMGFLTRSYFVSVFYPYKTLEETIEYYNASDPERKPALLREVAAFVLKLHKLGVYHEDLSPGNILIMPMLDGYDFALLDLNRVRFKRQVNFAAAIRNFSTLKMSQEDRNAVIREYAKLRGRPTETAVDRFWKYEHRKSFLRRLRKRIRRYTIGSVENLFR